MATSRISLASLFENYTDSILEKDFEPQQEVSPTLKDLTECLYFSPGDGRIWLNNQRMLLVHNHSFGTLRRELINLIGMEKTRGLLTRAGYVSGMRDAELVKEQWKGGDPLSIFLAGTKLHALEGAVKVEPVNYEVDIKQGIYKGEFLWYHSSEDEVHIEHFGIGSEPACWMELGYAMGYVSGLVGTLIIFREVECRAMGHAACRVIGQSASLWADIEEDLRYINVSDDELRSKPQNAASFIPTSSLIKTQFPVQERSPLIGNSSTFTAANHALQKVATTQATVLFSGESGVGKEMFANRLHALSSRNNGPFVAFNCAAIPENLLEAELFGVEKGAYTGATCSRPGRFERANGGTLFLDEIGNLNMTGQSKLLRVLQEREVERVGGTQPIKVDVRVVAATNVDLKAAVAKGEFREDLFYRLNVFPIVLPPLRERRSDIPLLINHFFGHFCQLYDRHPSGITQKATNALLHYHFPGNIRELQNMIERGVIASEEDEPVDLHHLFRNEKMPDDIIFAVHHSGSLRHQTASHGSDNHSLISHLSKLSNQSGAIDFVDLEKQLLEEVVHEAKGNLSEAARRIGLTRPQLAYRLKKFEIEPSS